MNDEPQIRSMSARELRERINTRSESEHDLIDVRQPSEYEAGHIPGAKLIPLRELPARLDELHPDREQIFYCSVGGRSLAAAIMAAESGAFPKGVSNLEGGIKAWDGKSLPDRPPLRLFGGRATRREAILTALELEKGSWSFYTELLKEPPGGFACATLQDLAEAKKGNAALLHDRLKKMSSEEEAEGMAPFEVVFDNLAGGILASGDDPAPLLDWVKKTREDCAQLVALAVELEYKAYDLYRNLAFDARGVEEEQAFLDLCDREKRLIARLAGEMDAAMDRAA